MISTKIHACIDYLLGVLLIVLPFILDFPEGAATILPIVLGAGTILYSLITDYEYGLLKILSVRAHLAIDFIAGLLLIAAPWLFDFAERLFWPFVILGILEIGITLMTRNTSSEKGNT